MRGFRVKPPLASDLVRWPPAWGNRFVVWCDVEEEFDWSAPMDPRHRSTEAMRAFPAAHRRFAELGTGLACMVDHPVACDPRAGEMLRRALEDGRSHVGAQLHAWVTPPYAPAMPGDTFPGNLPRALEEAKIDTITTALIAAFGQHPLVYRAGRYGLGPATADVLASRGYRLDTSVRARYDYRAQQGPDFTAIGNDAYRLNDTIVELPLSTVFTGRWRHVAGALYPRIGWLPKGRAVLARAGLVQRVALTPEDMPIADALEAISIAAGEGTRLLNLSFHSPSLEPGHTPYVRDQADRRAFWQWWDRALQRLAQLNYTPISIKEIVASTTPGS